MTVNDFNSHENSKIHARRNCRVYDADKIIYRCSFSKNIPSGEVKLERENVLRFHGVKFLPTA